MTNINLCDALRNLVPFVQFKKREKHPWRSVILACNFTKTPSMGVFHVFYIVQMLPNRATHYNYEICF